MMIRTWCWFMVWFLRCGWQSPPGSAPPPRRAVRCGRLTCVRSPRRLHRALGSNQPWPTTSTTTAAPVIALAPGSGRATPPRPPAPGKCRWPRPSRLPVGCWGCDPHRPPGRAGTRPAHGHAFVGTALRHRTWFSVTARMIPTVTGGRDHHHPDVRLGADRVPSAVFDQDEQRWVSDAQVTQVPLSRSPAAAAQNGSRAGWSCAGSNGSGRWPPAAGSRVSCSRPTATTG